MITYTCDFCGGVTNDFSRITVTKPGIVSMGTGGPMQLHFCTWSCVRRYAKEKQR